MRQEHLTHRATPRGRTMRYSSNCSGGENLAVLAIGHRPRFTRSFIQVLPCTPVPRPVTSVAKLTLYDTPTSAP